jgi:hypothetical protein
MTPAKGCCCIVVFGPLLLIVIQCGFLPLIDPIRRSDNSVQEWLLKKTPIGTPRHEVETFIEERGWTKGGRYRSEEIDKVGRANVEKHWLDYRLGSYWNVFDTTVYAEWHFDETGKLDSIHVWKFTITP